MSDLRTVPLSDVFPGDNIRVSLPGDDDDRDLSRSIREHGLLQPLIVREAQGGKYRLVAGHRRYEAALDVGLAEVPVIVQSGDDAIVQLIENTQRAAMDTMDVARAIVALLDNHPDMTQEMLARRLGRSPSYVSDALNRCRRDPQTQRDIARGRIKGRAASLMTNRSQTERDQLVRMSDAAPGTLQKVVTRPSTKAMRTPVQDGWAIELSWDGKSDEARLDLLTSASVYEGGVRFDLRQLRRLQRGLRLLGDAMERIWVKADGSREDAA